MYSHSQIEETISKHKALSNAAKELKVNTATLYKYVKSNNLDHLRVYGANVINTPRTDAEWGYLCGLLATDGNLAKGRKLITISLQNQDKATVDWVASQCSCNKLAKKAKNNQWVFWSNNEIVYDYCMDMGITPAKSLILDPNFSGKSEEFLWYFLRGTIDGDGYVSFSCPTLRNPRYTLSIGLCSGSKKFLLRIKEIFGGTLYEDKNRRFFNLVFSSTKAQTLAKFLPMDSFTMLRKTKKLQEILNVENLSKRKAKSVLEGSIWQNSEKYPQPKSWRLIYRKIESPIVSEETVRSRLRLGWSLEKALNTPLKNTSN